MNTPPTILAVIRVNISGRTNCSFLRTKVRIVRKRRADLNTHPVHSSSITVKLIVILAMPPRTAAAPIRAYVLLKASFGCSRKAKFPNSRPKAAPDSRLGTNKPDGTAMP